MPSPAELGNWPYYDPKDYIQQNAQAFERGAKQAQIDRDKKENARDLREFYKALGTIFSLDKKHVAQGEPSMFSDAGASAPGVTGSGGPGAPAVTPGGEAQPPGPPMASAPGFTSPPVPDLSSMFSLPGSLPAQASAVQPPMAPPGMIAAPGAAEQPPVPAVSAAGVTAPASSPAAAVTSRAPAAGAPPVGVDRLAGILQALSGAPNPMLATEATNKLFGNVAVEPKLHNVPANNTVLDAAGNVVYQAPKKKQTLRLGSNQVAFEENDDGTWSQVAAGPAGGTRYTQIQDNQGYYYMFDPINKAAIPTGVQGVIKGGAYSRWIRLTDQTGQVQLVDALDPTNTVSTGMFTPGKSPYDYGQAGELQDKKALSAEKIARLKIAAQERIAAFERETKERIDSPAKLFTHLLKNDRLGLSTDEDRELLDYLAPIVEKEGTLTTIIKQDAGTKGPQKPWQPPAPAAPPAPEKKGWLERTFGSRSESTATEPGDRGTPAQPSGGNAEPPVPASLRKGPKVTGQPAKTAPAPGASPAPKAAAGAPGAGPRDFGPEIKLQDGTVAKKEADGNYYFVRNGQKYLLRPKSPGAPGKPKGK